MSGLREDMCEETKAICGGLLLLASNGTRIDFKCIESRPTEQALKAFRELVDAGIMTEERFNKLGGYSFIVKDDVDMGAFRARAQKWAEKVTSGDFPNFNITEPIE